MRLNRQSSRATWTPTTQVKSTDSPLNKHNVNLTFISRLKQPSAPRRQTNEHLVQTYDSDNKISHKKYILHRYTQKQERDFQASCVCHVDFQNRCQNDNNIHGSVPQTCTRLPLAQLTPAYHQSLAKIDFRNFILTCLIGHPLLFPEGKLYIIYKNSCCGIRIQMLTAKSCIMQTVCEFL